MYWTVPLSGDCKETPIGLLHAEKLNEVVLRYVFKISFLIPSVPLMEDNISSFETFKPLEYISLLLWCVGQCSGLGSMLDTGTVNKYTKVFFETKSLVYILYSFRPKSGPPTIHQTSPTLCCCCSHFPLCWALHSTRTQAMGEPSHISSIAPL